MAKRIGPNMQAAAEYVRQHPNCTKLAAAEAVGPHGSRRHGYAAVDRAIGAGLIYATLITKAKYALTVR